MKNTALDVNSPSSFEQYVIDFVKKFRESNNISQNEIANAIGARQSFVSKVENAKYPNKYNMDHVNLLANYFRISPKEFMPAHPILEYKKRV